MHGYALHLTSPQVSPCGLYVASASIGSAADTSILLAWRLRDGSSVNTAKSDLRPKPLEDKEDIDPVLQAGGSCVVAKGCFTGGVGALVSLSFHFCEHNGLIFSSFLALVFSFLVSRHGLWIPASLSL